MRIYKKTGRIEKYSKQEIWEQWRSRKKKGINKRKRCSDRFYLRELNNSSSSISKRESEGEKVDFEGIRNGSNGRIYEEIRLPSIQHLQLEGERVLNTMESRRPHIIQGNGNKEFALEEINFFNFTYYTHLISNSIPLYYPNYYYYYYSHHIQ